MIYFVRSIGKLLFLRYSLEQLRSATFDLLRPCRPLHTAGARNDRRMRALQEGYGELCNGVGMMTLGRARKLRKSWKRSSIRQFHAQAGDRPSLNLTVSPCLGIPPPGSG